MGRSRPRTAASDRRALRRRVLRQGARHRAARDSRRGRVDGHSADARRSRERIRRLRPFYLTFVLIAVIFVGVRARVLADHSIGGFQPFTPFNTLHISTSATACSRRSASCREWLRLLYWPAHLSSEYGPPDDRDRAGIERARRCPGSCCSSRCSRSAVVLRRRAAGDQLRHRVRCITLLPSSNFVLPAGIVLAERTLFLPSVGAMLVVGALCAWSRATGRARFGERRDLRAPAMGALALLLLAASCAKRSTHDGVARQRSSLSSGGDRFAAGVSRALHARRVGVREQAQARGRSGVPQGAEPVSVRSVPLVQHGGAVSRRRTVRSGASVVSMDARAGSEFPAGPRRIRVVSLERRALRRGEKRARSTRFASAATSRRMRRVIFLADSVSGRGAQARSRWESSRRRATPWQTARVRAKGRQTTDVHPRG